MYYLVAVEFEHAGEPICRLAPVDQLKIYSERVVEIDLDAASDWKKAFVRDVATIKMPPHADAVYGLYRATEVSQFRTMCQSVSGTYCVATVVSPFELQAKDLAPLTVAWAYDNTVEKLIAAFRSCATSWLYCVGYHYPLARTVFLTRDAGLVQQVVEAGTPLADFRVIQSNVE